MKIENIRITNRSVRISDLRMGTVIRGPEDHYIVLAIGAAFVEVPGEGLGITMERNTAILGYYSPDEDPHKLKDDPKMRIYYNLLCDPLTEDFESRALAVPLSEKEKEDLRNTPLQIATHERRSHLQNILFSIHTHDEVGNIIYREIDLERMCTLMISEIDDEAVRLGQSERHTTVSEAWRDVFYQMKQFFTHKI
jgi:hypothetical protein